MVTKGAAGCFGVLDEVLPSVGIVLFEEDGGDVFGDEGIETAHAVAGDEGHHVVLERYEIVGLHSMAIVSETGVSRTGIRCGELWTSSKPGGWHFGDTGPEAPCLRDIVEGKRDDFF